MASKAKLLVVDDEAAIARPLIGDFKVRGREQQFGREPAPDSCTLPSP